MYDRDRNVECEYVLDSVRAAYIGGNNENKR